MEALRVRLLGGFHVAIGGRVIDAAAWRRRKAAALVKLLALAPARRLHREQLVDHLWPDLELAAAINQLHQTVRWARLAIASGLDAADADRARDLASRYLGFQGAELRLGLAAPVEVDVDRFEQAVRQARAAPEVAALRAAAALYTGELLPEDPYQEWLEPHREQARRACVEVLVALARLHAARGEGAAAIGVWQNLLGVEPANEDAHVALMRLYAETGQRHEALRQFQRLSQALQRDLDLEPAPATRQLQQRILAGEYPAAPAANPAVASPVAPPGGTGAASPAARPNPDPAVAAGLDSSRPAAPRSNLPAPVNAFVGRAEELARLDDRLAACRVLTLCGVGGVGKTRTAIEVARRLAPRFPDGIWLVELAPIADAPLVPQTVSAVLGTLGDSGQGTVDRLVSQLRDRTALLLFDNCEHLIDACARLADTLLKRCPGVRILATSREPLRIAGEQVVNLAPLALPPDEAPEPSVPGVGRAAGAGAAASEAIRLFVDRAVAVRPEFRLAPDNVAAIVRICRRLDGIPLAIELAAARVAVDTVAAIADGLDDSFSLLTRGSRAELPRQRTLRASLDWSYQWLSEAEQRLFRDLAVFAGGFETAAVAAVSPSAGPEPVLREVLAGLVDKSLVVAETGGARTRYRLLETVRSYAGLRLAESGELAASRDRHLAHYLALAERAAPAINAGGQREWLPRLDLERDNLRGALEWAHARAREAITQGEPAGAAAAADLVLRLTVAHYRYLDVRGAYDEAWQQLTAALALPGSAPLRLRTHGEAAYMARQRGDLAAARAHLDQAEAIVAAHADAPDRNGRDFELSVALLKMVSAVVASDRGEFQRADALARAALGIYDRLDDDFGRAVMWTWVGIAAMHAGLPELAMQHFERAVAIRRQIGDEVGLAIVLLSLARVESTQGLIDQARQHVQESYALGLALGFPMIVADALWILAVLAIRQHDSQAAGGLLATSLTVFAETGHRRFLMRTLYIVARLGDLIGLPVESARLLGSIAGLAPDHVAVLYPSERPLLDELTVSLRAQLGEAAFEAETRAAADWSTDTTLRVARQLIERAAPSARAGTATHLDPLAAKGHLRRLG